MAARIGSSPVNKQTERNAVIIAALQAGIHAADVARTYGITRQRISQIWQKYGDGYDMLAFRREQQRRARTPAASRDAAHGR